MALQNSDRIKMILLEISKNNRLPINDLAKATGVSRRTLTRDLTKLKEQARILRVDLIKLVIGR